MPLTSAEKSKRYREKVKQTDPERYKEILIRSSERALKHYREKISNMNEEEKEDLRARWREDNKKYKSSSQPNQLPHNETSQNKLAKQNRQQNLRNENDKISKQSLEDTKHELFAAMAEYYRAKTRKLEIEIEILKQSL